ncbi:MAG: hypothetical protein WCZ43_03475 [Proteiniphilum sp.]
MDRRKFVKTAVMTSAASLSATSFGFSKYQLPVGDLQVDVPAVIGFMGKSRHSPL